MVYLRKLFITSLTYKLFKPEESFIYQYIGEWFKSQGTISSIWQIHSILDDK